MPTAGANKTQARPERETWIHWAGPDAPEPRPETLLTRDELLTRLQEMGVNATAFDLVNWQTKGAIPYGVRRRHAGATRVLYAPWMIDIIRDLRAMQAQKTPLTEMGHVLRTKARTLAARRDAAIQGSTATTSVSTPPGSFRTISVHDTLSADVEETASVVKAAVPDDIAHRLLEWAREHEQAFGVKVARVDVSLIDDRGRPLTFPFDVATS